MLHSYCDEPSFEHSKNPFGGEGKCGRRWRTSTEPLLLLGQEHSSILSRKGTSFSYTVFFPRPGDPANTAASRRSLVNLAKVILMRFTAKSLIASGEFNKSSAFRLGYCHSVTITLKRSMKWCCLLLQWLQQLAKLGLLSCFLRWEFR